MSLNYLRERHTFRAGEFVNVTEREGSRKHYNGKIHSILSLPINAGLPSEYTDHFYISFPKEDYNSILILGSQVIYNGKPTMLGNVIKDSSGRITKLYRQERYAIGEDEINIDGINAALIWRVGYEISR
jgi:hypothetical protein